MQDLQTFKLAHVLFADEIFKLRGNTSKKVRIYFIRIRMEVSTDNRSATIIVIKYTGVLY